MNGNTAELFKMPLDGGGGTVCQESCSWLWLDHARNQFPYASCADISGSGRRSFGVCRFAGGASRLGKLAQASTDVGITARRGGQCFQAGEREAREAEGMFPLPLRWGLAFASRGKLALLDRKGNARRGEQCFPAGERGTRGAVFSSRERGARTAAGGIPFFVPGGAGIFPILNSNQHNISLNTKG